MSPKTAIMRFILGFGLSLALLWGFSLAVSAAGAQEPADQGSRAEAVAAGQILAEDLCSRCHAVGRSGDSPVADAPPFRILGSLWPIHYLEEALAEGIMVGHPSSEMPVFQFTTTEIAQLIAYLETIQVDQPTDDMTMGDMAQP